MRETLDATVIRVLAPMALKKTLAPTASNVYCSTPYPAGSQQKNENWIFLALE
jgi:hypothetical protein